MNGARAKSGAAENKNRKFDRGNSSKLNIYSMHDLDKDRNVRYQVGMY